MFKYNILPKLVGANCRTKSLKTMEKVGDCGWNKLDGQGLLRSAEEENKKININNTWYYGEKKKIIISKKK